MCICFVVSGVTVPPDGPPPPPSHLVVEPISDTSVHVTWKAPSPNTAITKYTIKYKSMAADPLNLNMKGVFNYIQR